MKKRAFRLLQILVRFGVIKFAEIILKDIFSKNTFVVRVSGIPLHFRKNSSDLEVFRQIFVKREYQNCNLKGEMPKVIIDAGCNNGFSMAYFKSKYPDATIIGVEPDKSNFLMAQKNTASLSGVFLENKALWYETSTVQLRDTGKGDYAFSIIHHGEVVSTVDTITMDGIMSKYKLDVIDILKVDIEGAEKEIFTSGDNAWLGKVRCIIIELHDWIDEGCSEAMFKALRPYVFSVSVSGENFVIRFTHDAEVTAMMPESVALIEQE